MLIPTFHIESAISYPSGSSEVRKLLYICPRTNPAAVLTEMLGVPLPGNSIPSYGYPAPSPGCQKSSTRTMRSKGAVTNSSIVRSLFGPILSVRHLTPEAVPLTSPSVRLL